MRPGLTAGIASRMENVVENRAEVPAAPPLPSTVADWSAARKGNLKRTLNDMVEECHLNLISNEKYLGYLRAIWDSLCNEEEMPTSPPIKIMTYAEMMERKRKASENRRAKRAAGQMRSA